jgi:hypothetical protein
MACAAGALNAEDTHRFPEEMTGRLKLIVPSPVGRGLG